MNTSNDLSFLQLGKDLHQSVMSAPIGICVLNADGLVAEIVNDKFLEVAGKPREAILGKNYWEPFAEARAYYETALQQVADTGVAFHAQEVELMLIRQGKEEIIFVTFVYSPLLDASGKTSKIVVWVLENTQQVLARKRIAEAEEKARIAIRSANLGLYETTFHNDSMTTDKRFDEIWGTPGPFKFRSEYAAYFHPDDLQHRALAHEQSMITSQVDYQARIIWPDQSIRWVRVTGNVVRENGEPYKLVGVVQDVTDIVIAQRKLEATEASLRQAVDLANLGTWHVNVDTNFTSMSPLLMSWFGIEGEGADAETLIGCIRQDQREMVGNALFSTLQPGSDGIYNVEYTVINCRTGQHRILHVLGQSFFDKDGKALRISGIARDVTIERQLQLALEHEVQERTEELESSNARLRQSNEELAQFAYIASHDLQEPLRKIMTFSEMLGKSLGDNISDKTKNYLQKINGSSLRMHTLIKDVLAYSQLVKETEVFTAVDLNQVIEEVKDDFDLFIEQTGMAIESDPLPVIEAIPAQMVQLFGNLLGNSMKFSKHGIQPVIRLRIGQPTETELQRLGLNPEGNYTKILFSDNGIGINPDYAEQIFQIFQRLHRKSEYEGTGIGLAMCRKIAINHNGAIHAMESNNEGATFTIILPLAHANQ
jgi:PAS domain S-box-containing protein